MIRSAKQLAELEHSYNSALTGAAARIVVWPRLARLVGLGPSTTGLWKSLQNRGSHVTVDYLMENGAKPGSGIVALESGCQGFCQKGPLVRIEPEGLLYTKVHPEDVPELVEAVIEGKILDRLLYSDPATGEVYAREQDIPFYQDQVRIALHNCGAIDPEDIRAYLGKKGYQGLARALTMEKQDVIEELDQANLRAEAVAVSPRRASGPSPQPKAALIKS